MMEEVEVHELSDKPTEFWKSWKNTVNIMRLQVRHPSSPPPENKLRFVCMADTHSLTSHLKQNIPHGDVFIHAGDFTRCGSISEVREFNTWLNKLPHKHKIVIAGNHELSFDPAFHNMIDDRGIPTGKSSHIGNSPMHICQKILAMDSMGIDRDQLQSAVSEGKCEDIKRELTGCEYLEDSSIEICGLKIYGTPWQPEFSGWAFNLPRGSQCLKRWNNIPTDTDILITHTPPLGFGDLCSTGVRAGCVDLLRSVQKRIKPKYHIYGHIHEGYGVRSDGKILFINASTCDINYLPCNPPVVFDVPLPDGRLRDW